MNKETIDKGKKDLTELVLTATVCKFHINGNQRTDNYKANIKKCSLCKKNFGKTIYQTRCGHTYCPKCFSKKQTNKYMMKCNKCNDTEVIVVCRESKDNINKAWQCLCFDCYFECHPK